MAVEKVRFVGEPVVAVVATSRYVAEDALEHIDVEYEPLETAVTIEEASRMAPRCFMNRTGQTSPGTGSLLMERSRRTLPKRMK